MLYMGEEDIYKQKLFFLFSSGYFIGYEKGIQGVYNTEKGLGYRILEKSELGEIAMKDFNEIYEKLKEVFEKLKEE